MDSKVLELGQINFEIDKESDKLMPSKTLFGDLTVLTSVHPSHRRTNEFRDVVWPKCKGESNEMKCRPLSDTLLNFV